jgi:hypothetical protein
VFAPPALLPLPQLLQLLRLPLKQQPLPLLLWHLLPRCCLRLALLPLQLQARSASPCDGGCHLLQKLLLQLALS